MRREELFAYAQERFGTTPDYPWARYPDYAVLRHQPSRKWYALVASVPAERLGLEVAGDVEILNVKVDPDDALALRLVSDIMPAYHMNKKNWISVRLDGGLSDDLIEELLDASYALTS